MEATTMTTVQLRKYAAELGIRGMSSARKADLLEAIAKQETFNATFVNAEHKAASDAGDEINAIIAANAEKANLEAEEELREAAREHDAAAEEISAKSAVVNPVDELLDVDEAGRNAHRAAPVTAKSGKAAYVAIYVNSDFRVHGVKCADVKRDKAASEGATIRYPATATPASIAADLYSDFIPDEMTVDDALATVDFLPCCKFDDAATANDGTASAPAAPKPAKKSAAKKGKEAAVGFVRDENGITHPKAAQFVRDAVEAGWSFGSISETGTVTEVTVIRVGGEWIRISWDGKACLNGTEHKDSAGKVRKVRNASAARAVLVS